MATARDIVERALRKIGVVASDEAMTPDQAANGVDALNMMMHGWVMDGIDIAHTDLDAADEVPLQPQFIEGCVYLLAERLAPDFSMQGFDVRAFKRRLSAAYLIIPDARIDTGLRNTSSQRRWHR